MKKVPLLFKRLPHGEGLPLPKQQHDEDYVDAGMDIAAAHDEVIESGDYKMIRTGFCVAVPKEYVLDVRSRSGMAKEEGVVVLNSPGTIDSGYRGEIGVILINHGSNTFHIRRGERVAQLVLLPCPEVEAIEVEALDATERGENGFGSTGVR